MRATWLTSLVSGVLFGLFCRITENPMPFLEVVERETLSWLVLVLFFLLLFTSVVGVVQIRELRNHLNLPAFFHIEDDADEWAALYQPLWGRLLVFFVSLICTTWMCSMLVA